MALSSIPTLFTATLFLFFSAYVFLQNPSNPNNRLFSLWCLLVVHWQTSWTILFNTDNVSLADLIIRIGYSGIIFLPTVLVHFVIQFCGKQIKHSYLILIYYFFTCFILSAIWAGNRFISGHYIYSWGFYPKAAQPFHPVFLIFCFATFLHIIFLLVGEVNNPANSTERKNQIKYFMVAVLIFYLASSDFMVNYGYSFYPVGFIPITIFLLLISYAIIRYQLLEISILIRRATLLVTVYLSLLFLNIPAIFVLYRYMVQQGNPLLFFIGGCLFCGAIMSTGPMIYAYFIRSKTYFRETTVSGLTHELKSPVAIIQSAVEALTANSHPLDSKENEYFEIVYRNLSRLKSSIDNLTLVFGNQDFRAHLNQTEVNISDLIDEVVQSYKDAVIARNCVLQIKIAADHLSIMCDKEKVHQVLSNLLSNALKFTRDGCISINGDHMGAYLRMSISDNGTGISREDLPYIFERFYRSANQERSSGTGLGLTIARTWVEAHGGRIWAESEGEGRGAKISFTIPVK